MKPRLMDKSGTASLTISTDCLHEDRYHLWVKLPEASLSESLCSCGGNPQCALCRGVYPNDFDWATRRDQLRRLGQAKNERQRDARKRRAYVYLPDHGQPRWWWERSFLERMLPSEFEVAQVDEFEITQKEDALHVRYSGDAIGHVIYECRGQGREIWHAMSPRGELVESCISEREALEALLDVATSPNQGQGGELCQD